MENFALQAVLLFAFMMFAFQFFNSKKRKIGTGPMTPPSPPKLPIIGHLHYFTEMPHHAFTKLANKFGPIISLQLGRVPTIVISSAHYAQLAFKSNDLAFSNRPKFLAAEYLSYDYTDIVFAQYGPHWRQARKICVYELLSAKRVSSFQLVRDEEVNRMLSTLSNLSGSEVDISNQFFKLMNDILCLVAFGKRFINEETREKGQTRNLQEVMNEIQALLTGLCMADFFPGWEWLNTMTGFKRKLKKTTAKQTAVCDEIVEEHLEKNRSGKADSGREDFVDVLLRVQQQDDLEVPITIESLKSIVMDMFVAGTDTSAATLAWTMTELARHPKIMQKVQAEIREIVSSKGSVNENDVLNIHYLRAVIKESMRLHPPGPLLLPRETTQKCNLGGYEIPEKTRVIFNYYAISRDPESWKNPLEFNPERFIESDIDVKGQDCRFLPFGGGRRICPGASFAMATMEIALARLLYHFDWTLPKGMRADDVDLSEEFGLAAKKKTALILVPTANKDYEFKGIA